MIRLFIQFYSGMLLAMLSAALFMVWLMNNPINKIEGDELQSYMIYAAHTVVNRLRNTEETHWNTVVDRYMEYFDDLVLIWRPLDDPQLAEDQRNQLEWGKPILLESEENGPQVLLRLPNTETVIGVGQRKPLDNLYSKEVLIAGGGALGIIGVVGFVMVFIIVTRLKALQSVSTQLGHGNWSVRADSRQADAISQLASSFNQMADRIEKLIDEKNELLQEQRELFQAVAHEFRKPMSRLNFAVHLLSASVVDGSDSKLREDMDQSLTDLNSLLSEVLRYSRLQPGTPLLKAKKTLVGDVIESIVEQQNKTSATLGIDVEKSLNSTVYAVLDPYYFHRAVLNLVRNAVTHAQHRVRVGWTLSGQHFHVSIEDDGEGVPEKKRKLIFKPFTRIDHSRSRNPGGMGLGLAIVERISEKHRGTVFVDDSPLGGARFQLCWPLDYTTVLQRDR